MGAAILTISLWNQLPHLNLSLWLATYVMLNLLRRNLVSRYFSLGFTAVTPRTWETKFAAGTIAGGLLWGVAAIFLFPENSIPHQYMLALFLVGISCGGAAFYWPSKTVYIPTILVELVPISGRFFFIADETAIVTGIVILLFCVMVLRMARYLNLSETESLKLRLEKEELANSLKESRDELEKNRGKDR